MKKLNIRSLTSAMLFAFVLTSCLQGDPMNTPPNATSNIVSTAINSNGAWEITPMAVAASATEVEYDLILVTLSSPNGPAAQDVHISMVPALDSLANYNSAMFDDHDPQTGAVTKSHPELYYVMPGGTGTPNFTLEDDGVVTIPKGSNVGYLKIKTISANYFGSTNYAFAYRISSVQESGYTVSANNAYNITPFLAKNPYDGIYDLKITTKGWGAYGIADDNTSREYGKVALSTTGLTSCIFNNLVRGDNLQPGFTSAEAKTGFGAATPNFVFDSNNKLVNVFNSVPDDGRGRAFSLNPAATAQQNLYDPTNKVLIANYLFRQNGRPDCTVVMNMTYVGPR